MNKFLVLDRVRIVKYEAHIDTIYLNTDYIIYLESCSGSKAKTIIYLNNTDKSIKVTQSVAELREKINKLNQI